LTQLAEVSTAATTVDDVRDGLRAIKDIITSGEPELVLNITSRLLVTEPDGLSPALATQIRRAHAWAQIQMVRDPRTSPDRALELCSDVIVFMRNLVNDPATVRDSEWVTLTLDLVYALYYMERDDEAQQYVATVEAAINSNPTHKHTPALREQLNKMRVSYGQLVLARSHKAPARV
jgi:hypothetical protein